MAKTDIRSVLWRRHLRLVKPLEDRFARDYRALMGDLRESIRTSGAKPFDLSKWQGRAVEAMRPAYRSAILNGGRAFLTGTVSVRQKVASGALTKAKARTADVVVSLEALFADRLRATIETTYDALESVLQEAVSDKLDTEEVNDLIEEEWSDILGPRTDFIALTETNGAVNSVRDYLMQEIVELQRWINAADERVRPTHVLYGEAGAKPVGFDFATLVPDAGYTLRYPCDPECHEPGEVINCRCFVVPEGELQLAPADLKEYLADFEMDPEDLLRSEDQTPVYVVNQNTGKAARVVAKGDYEGHPFRGNQYTDGQGGPRAPHERVAEVSDLMAKLTRAYAKDPGYFESDAFSGGSGDSYSEEADLSSKLYAIHDRQRADFERLGIEWDGDSPLSMWGGTAPQAGEEHSHPIFDTNDSRANMLAATQLAEEVIAYVEAAPPEVRALLKDMPLKINYTAESPKVVKDGQTFTQGAAVGYTTINGRAHDLTLYLHRATSTDANAVPHEMGHVFTAALHHLSPDDARERIAAITTAYEAEGGISEYADSFRGDRRITTSRVAIGPNESYAEVESLRAMFNRKWKVPAGKEDDLAFATMLARGRGLDGLIPGFRGHKAFPKTAVAWLRASGRAKRFGGPAPKDIDKWSPDDYAEAWRWHRLSVLSTQGEDSDPGAFDPDTSPEALRQRWSFLKKGVTKGDYEGHPFRGNQWTEGIGGLTRGEVASAYERAQIANWLKYGDTPDGSLGEIDTPEGRAWANENPDLFGAMVERWRNSTEGFSAQDWSNWGSGHIDDIVEAIDRGEMPRERSGEQYSAGFGNTVNRMSDAYGLLTRLSDASRETDPDETLLRGMVLSDDRPLPGVGGTFYDPIMSFTSNPAVAERFASSPSKSEGRVILKLEGRAKGPVRIGDQQGESETLLGGRFEVAKIERNEQGVSIYTIRQVEPVRPPAPPWKLRGEAPSILSGQWRVERERRTERESRRMLEEIRDAEESGRALTKEQEESFMEEYRRRLYGKGYFDQSRDPRGRFGPRGGIEAGSGAARGGRDQRVDGDGAHHVESAHSLSAWARVDAALRDREAALGKVTHPLVARRQALQERVNFLSTWPNENVPKADRAHWHARLRAAEAELGHAMKSA